MVQKKEEVQKPYQSCSLIMLLVVVLLLALAYFAIYRDKPSASRFGKSMRGGKWVARGGCACQLPQ